jgi:hypothetical protein
LFDHHAGGHEVISQHGFDLHFLMANYTIFYILIRCLYIFFGKITTQKVEIRRITVQSQSGQIVCETLSQKIPITKTTGGVGQGENPEFKPQYCKTYEFYELSSPVPP